MSNNLVIFKTITTFVNELSELFGEAHHHLKLYAHLLNKTTIAHDIPIQKHVNIFKTFCLENREAICSKDFSKFTLDRLEYSEKVYIEMSVIFKEADKETSNAIWKHLLYISALVDPTGKAKEILKDVKSNESDFLTNMMEKVEKLSVDESADPMTAMSTIMSSGILNELVGGLGQGMQDGSLDMGKMLGMVQGLMTSLPSEGDSGGADLTQMMTMMSSMMGGMNMGGTTQPEIEDETPTIEELE